MTVTWVKLDTTNTGKEDMVIEAIQEEPMEEALVTRAVTLMTQRTLPGEAQEAQEAQEAREIWRPTSRPSCQPRPLG